MKPTEKKMKYFVTSKPGMEPFSWVATLAEARRDAKLAKRLGLDGVIVEPKNEWVEKVIAPEV